mgnify:FL=1
MDILIFLSEFMVPLTVFYIVGFGILAKRPVFDDFLDGAKEGMHTVADVLPTLIGLMTAVGVLRASGILEAVSVGCAPVINQYKALSNLRSIVAGLVFGL